MAAHAAAMNDLSHVEPSAPSAPPQQATGPTGLWVAMALLMLAAFIRIPAFAYTDSRMNPFFFASEWLVIIAVIYAADRLIALFNGNSGLSRLDFLARMTAGGKAIIPMAVMCMTLVVLSQIVGDMAGWQDFDGERIFLRGIDGIAFDQMTDAGRVFSAALAGMLMIYVIERGERSALSLRRALVILLHHSPYLAAGIGLCSLFMLGLSGLQDSARSEVAGLVHSLDSIMAKNAAIALFAGSFACVRLIGVVAIFTLVLRASYRRRAAGA